WRANLMVPGLIVLSLIVVSGGAAGLAAARVIDTNSLLKLIYPAHTATRPPAPVTVVIPTTTPAPPSPLPATAPASPPSPPTMTPSPTATVAQPTLTMSPTNSPTLGPTPLGGGPGQIAFVSERVGLPQIFLMNMDGSNAQQLTFLPDGACQPAW